MADKNRSWNVPQNLPEIAHYAQNVDTDGVDPLSVEESMQAFADAEAIARRLGGVVNVAPLRVERSDGWITAGYVFHHQTFAEGIRRKQPEPQTEVVEPESEPVAA